MRTTTKGRPEKALDRLERRTNRVYWSDGLLDLMAGVALVGIGVAWLGDAVVFGALAPALVIPLWKPMRRAFSEPRLGRFEPGDDRQARTAQLLRMSLVGGVLALLVALGVVGLTEARPALAASMVPALPGALIGALALATAVGLELPRFFAYAGVFAGAGVAVAMHGTADPGWAMICGGGVMLLVGVVMAIRLAQTRPATEHSS